MMPGTVAGETARGDSMAKRGRKRAKTERGGSAGRPVAHVLQLVAALKAEQEAGSPLALANDAAERVKLMSWLKRFLAARDEERGAWESRVAALEAQLHDAQDAEAVARAALEQDAAQHARLVADLKLMHEHQSSIWQLERRRLEITLGALEQKQRKSVSRKLARLARPALAAGLLLVSLAAVALSADSSVVKMAPLYLDDGARAAVIVLGSE